ncbi:urea ABC transporter ATP-binding subunit UrtE [Bacillus sp. FJAT-44742]|uniref:urea ABC transporter ATP-binding subunit UrtE n=1 Tax=Bacillus sp. FJAT-44742 TaxID=2014005 RepID=UPI000C244B6E|nr:urea ABC transporter ATP-binding subunit UrtE [Bacillus sp. FJAT-44742]
MLHLRELEVAYEESTVIRDISLKVKKGQIVCIMGRNGVGKSTLIKTVIGLLKAKKGSIHFQDKNVTKTSPDKRAKSGMGYVPQGRDIFPYLTVYENLLMGLEGRKNANKKIDSIIYEYFPVLLEMKNRKGGDLSGGQQQQLAIARALVAEPDFLLLDEPAEGIQPNIVQAIQKVIIDLKKEGSTSMLLVEQNFDFAQTVGDYFYVVNKGTIVYEGESLIETEVSRYLSV